MKQSMFCLLVILTLLMPTAILSHATAESGWKVYKVNVEDKVFKVPYKITNATIKSITAEPNDTGVTINIKNESKGGDILEITIPRDLIDLVETDERGFGVLDYEVWVYGSEQGTTFKEVNTSPCFHTVAINLPVGFETIVVDRGVIPEGTYKKVVVPPVNITTDKSNYERGETITLSGCTSLALDGARVILEVLNPEGKTFRSISIIPKIDGSFSTSLVVKGEHAINGTYTVKATYAGHTATSGFVVPEFPVNLMMITAIGLIGASIALRLKHNK